MRIITQRINKRLTTYGNDLEVLKNQKKRIWKITQKNKDVSSIESRVYQIKTNKEKILIKKSVVEIQAPCVIMER